MEKSDVLFLILSILVLLTIIIPRIFDLDAFRTPDEDRWMTRTNTFVQELSQGNFRDLLQSPTPGLTTQWLGALAIWANNWEIRKLPLVIGQSLLIIAIGYTFSRLWGKTTGMIITLLLALNPLLIAHTRIFGTDSLAALFLLLAFSLLLLWRKDEAPRYLYTSAFIYAAAILSKITTVLLAPCVVLLLFTPRKNWRSVTIWILTFLVSLTLLLPSTILNPITTVQNILGTFQSEGYTKLHTGQPTFYLKTLVFFTTPLHLVTLILLPFALKKRDSPIPRPHLILLLTFACLFTIALSVGSKKSDRYLLPVLLTLDVLAAAVTTIMLQKWPGRIFFTGLIVWQAIIAFALHPYYLAYINPLTKPFFNQQKLGWGEGLDLAAQYLNQKPNSSTLKVASYYPNEFAHYFHGDTIPIHQYDEPSINYTVLYRAMFDRGTDAWETDVVEKLKARQPEQVIKINDVEYAWIYKNEL